MPLASFSGPASATHGVVCGHVTADGAAVAGAGVTLLRGDQAVARATTGTDGRYLLACVPHGAYRLRVAPPAGARVLPVADLPVVSGPAVTRQDVALAAIVVAGVVRAHGQPVAGAEVRLAGGARAWTDDAGAYRLVGVEPGAHRLVARRGADQRTRGISVPTEGPVDIDLSA